MANKGICKFFGSPYGCKSGAKCWYKHEAVEQIEHSFKADSDDHCETPGCAYDDIAELLRWLAEHLGKDCAKLRIYDPYFCAGAVVRNLSERGFPNVYNKNEDFYATAAAGKCPKYDILVTNPPYSEDHVKKMLEFCVNSGRPWLALMPNYVYINKYYEPVMKAASCRPFYLVPSQRYKYTTPSEVRVKREKSTAPFLSFWYGDMGELNAKFIKFWREKYPQAGKSLQGSKDNYNSSDYVQLIGNRAQLPHRMRAMYDPTRRRLWKKQREAAERRKRKAGIGTHRKRKLPRLARQKKPTGINVGVQKTTRTRSKGA